MRKYNDELQCHRKQFFYTITNAPIWIIQQWIAVSQKAIFFTPQRTLQSELFVLNPDFLCLFYEVYRTSILEIGYVNNFDHREAWCITSSHPCFTNCISIVFAAKSGDDSNYDQGDLCFIILSRMLHHKTLLPSSSQVHLKRQQLLLLFPIKKYRYYKRLELYT